MELIQLERMLAVQGCEFKSPALISNILTRLDRCLLPQCCEWVFLGWSLLGALLVAQSSGKPVSKEYKWRVMDQDS